MADEDGLAAPFNDYLFDVVNGNYSAFSVRRTERTFLPSGIAAKSISTLACASTSAEADILTRKSAFEHDCQPLHPPTFPLHPTACSDTPSRPPRILTLHRSLRPRRRQQSHPPNHKILKRLIGRLALLAHIIGKTRYLRRRILLAILEGRFEAWCLFVFPRVTFDDVGFAAPLLGGSEE